MQASCTFIFQRADAPACLPASLLGDPVILPPLACRESCCPSLPASAGADWLPVFELPPLPAAAAEMVRHLRRLQELSLYGHRVHNLARLRRRVNMIRILVS